MVKYFLYNLLPNFSFLRLEYFGKYLKKLWSQYPLLSTIDLFLCVYFLHFVFIRVPECVVYKCVCVGRYESTAVIYQYYNACIFIKYLRFTSYFQRENGYVQCMCILLSAIALIIMLCICCGLCIHTCNISTFDRHAIREFEDRRKIPSPNRSLKQMRGILSSSCRCTCSIACPTTGRKNSRKNSRRISRAATPLIASSRHSLAHLFPSYIQLSTGNSHRKYSLWEGVGWSGLHQWIRKKRKERNGVLRRLQQLRSYRRNSLLFTNSSNGSFYCRGTDDSHHNAVHLYSDQANPLGDPAESRFASWLTLVMDFWIKGIEENLENLAPKHV